MTQHPIIITLKTDGAVGVVYHPDKQAALVETLTAGIGTTTEQARGGHVLPQQTLKRQAFRALRRLFGGAGAVADWTRSWAGPWVVVICKTGRELGPLPSYDAAVEAEVAYIQAEVI